MCKKLQLLGDFVTRPTTGATFFLDHTGGGGFRSPVITALSGNESFCFSLQLCFSYDVCSAPNSGGPAIRGTDSWLDDTD